MTDKEYFALDAISQSSLKTFIENRKAYEYTYVFGLGEGKKTKALDLGTLNHCLLFEPEQFNNRYAHFSGVVPSSPNMHKFIAYLANFSIDDAYANAYSTKGLKPHEITKKATDLYNELFPFIEFSEEHGHKELITSEMELQSRKMIDIVLNHHGVRKTLVAGRNNNDYIIHKEVALWMLDMRYNRSVKLKADEVHIDIKNQVIYAYDYKTTRTPNTNSFKGSAKYYGYDIQESFYSHYINEWAKGEYKLDFKVVFRFIPQLNVAPFNVLDVIEFDEVDREAAYVRWNEAFEQLDGCLRTGRFDNPSAYSESGVCKVKLNNVESVVLADGF